MTDDEESQPTIRWNPSLTEVREFLSSQPATAPPPRRSARIHSQEATTLAAAIKAIPQDHDSVELYIADQRELQLEVDTSLHTVKAMAHATIAKLNRKLKAIKTDELLQTTGPTELDSDIFEPAPEHWKQFLVLPPHLKKVWIDALRQEINTLLK